MHLRLALLLLTRLWPALLAPRAALAQDDLPTDPDARAAELHQRGYFTEEIEVYRALLAAEPLSPRSAERSFAIVQSYRKLGRAAEAVAEIDRMRLDYGPGSPWAQAAGEEIAREARAELELVMRTQALQLRAQMRGYDAPHAQREALYALAIRAHAVYLEEFPYGEHTIEMRYSYAEVLYKLKKYDQAYDQYLRVVQADPAGEHAEFCASSAIYAAEEMMKRQERASPSRPPPGSAAPVELTGWELRYLGAIDQYTQLYPEGKHAQGALYKGAYLLYENNRFDEAIPRFHAVIAKDPAAEAAPKAANLVLDALALRQDWAGLEAAARGFLDHPTLGDETFEAQMRQIAEQAAARRGEARP